MHYSSSEIQGGANWLGIVKVQKLFEKKLKGTCDFLLLCEHLVQLWGGHSNSVIIEFFSLLHI